MGKLVKLPEYLIHSQVSLYFCLLAYSKDSWIITTDMLHQRYNHILIYNSKNVYSIGGIGNNSKALR